MHAYLTTFVSKNHEEISPEKLRADWENTYCMTRKKKVNQ